MLWCILFLKILIYFSEVKGTCSMFYVIPIRKYVLEVAADFFAMKDLRLRTLVGIGNAHFWIFIGGCRCV